MHTSAGIPIWARALLGAWLVAIGVSFAALASYQAEAGLGARAADWPAQSTLAPPTTATLVLFLHPECACSRATLAEVQRLLPRVSGDYRVVILFSARGETLRPLAAAVPGATLHDDPDAAEAKLFGATTSGHTFVYDPEGRLLFHGGITAARAHEGPNRGIEHVVASLSGGSAQTLQRTPVFGCALYEITNEGDE